MPENAITRADYEALSELIVNCPDFDRLESLLGGFNLFQVLKFEHGEIRHSNVLSWILDPAESHGLGHTFLKKWLMRVAHETTSVVESPISPVDIDAWNLAEVEVRREWRNVDLLVILTLDSGEEWIICIENKVNSTQHSNQLRRYRAEVEKQFPEAARRMFILLTKDDELPEDERYLRASYAQVHRSLKEALDGRSHSIGPEPKVLLDNYLRLLEEKFMDESEIARTALRIYQQHRRALDVIFEHRPDNLRSVSEAVKKLLTDNSERLGIRMEPSSKSYIHFIATSWDQPGNSHGDAWSGSKRTVVFEMNLTGNKPLLNVTSGEAPDVWIDSLWIRAMQPPFRRPNRATRSKTYCTFHSVRVATAPATQWDSEDFDNPNDIAQKVYDWCAQSISDSRTQEVIGIIAAELPKLEEIHAARAS